MGKFVSRVDVAIDGEKINNMKTFKISPRKLRSAVKTMSGMGHVNHGVIDHQFTIDYAIPASNRFDFASVEDAALVVAAEDGGKINYSGVSCLEIGEEHYDDEKETVITVTFGAEQRSDD